MSVKEPLAATWVVAESPEEEDCTVTVASVKVVIPGTVT